MPKALNITNQRFGRLRALRPVGHGRAGLITWLCRCKCGKKTIVASRDLKTGNTRSCGCLFREGNKVIHGQTRFYKVSPAYRSWASMIQRCTNSNVRCYDRYGGRGIKVCKRWLKFKNFFADMGAKKAGYSIDRINN